MKEGVEMRKIFFAVICLLIIGLWGCKKSESGSTGTIVGPGGSLSNVKMVVTHQAGAQTTIFSFKSDTDVLVNKATIVVTSQNINESFNNPNPDDQLDKETWYDFVEYDNQYVISGEKWKFTFEGKTVGSKTDFTCVCEYTIP